MILGNILVAGGASGLGAAAVRAVQRHGGTPLVIDIAKPQDGVRYASADLADTASVDDAVRELADGVDGQLHGVFTPPASTAAARWTRYPPKSGNGWCMSTCSAPPR